MDTILSEDELVESLFHHSRPELGQHVTSSEEVKEGRDEEDES